MKKISELSQSEFAEVYRNYSRGRKRIRKRKVGAKRRERERGKNE